MLRKLRDITAASIGFILILLGFVSRAKKRVFESGAITGIYFHNPQKSLFEKSVKWLLKNGFTIITAGELLEILNGKKTAGKGSVWLSIDDGWKENITNVLPFAAENRIPVTFFLSTGPVESGGAFWWSAAEKYRNNLSEPYKSNIGLLWKVPEIERKKTISALLEKVNNQVPDEAMTVDDVKKIAGYDFLNIESHTVNHVITPNCSIEELNFELAESKKKLEEWTGKKVIFFSYPNGDYEEREKEFLIACGYKAAAVQDNKFINTDSDIFRIPRFSIGDGYFYEELCHMFGVWQSVIKKIKLK